MNHLTFPEGKNLFKQALQFPKSIFECPLFAYLLKIILEHMLEHCLHHIISLAKESLPIHIPT